MNRIEIIVPIHNQVNNIPRIIEGLKMQSESFSDVWFIFDRTEMLTEDEINTLTIPCEFSCHFVDFTPTDSEGFFAGAVRNFGIIQALGDGADIIIMIDGDCVPQRDLVKGHFEACKYNMPVLSCGRRREKAYRWKDRREYTPALYNAGFFAKDLIINDSKYLTECAVVWSCNIAMNRPAIKGIMALNQKYYGVTDVFHPAFDGKWGGEDSFLGVEAWIAKMFIVVNATASIEHIDHPTQPVHKQLEHKELFESMVKDIRLKTSLNPPDLKLFASCH